MSKRIGIFTGGGDAPGLNAVIRAVVKYGVEQKGWQIFGIEEAFSGLYLPNKKVWELTPQNCGDLLTRGGTILGTTNKGSPFELDENGRPFAETIARKCRELKLDGLIAIGGDGTQTIAYRFSQEYGIPVVGVPKTIDNDLQHTDFTFGFWSAINVATDALDRLHTTAESHDRIMFLEVMGRTAGWIALYAGLTGGADCIVIPEIPYSPDAFVKKIKQRKASGRDFTIVIVAEGATPIQEPQEESSTDAISRTSKRFVSGSASHHLVSYIQDKVDAECRITVLGHIQRGGSPAPFDRLLATRFGVHAIDLIAEEQWGRLVVLQDGAIRSVPLQDVAGAPRQISPTEDLILMARKMGIYFGDET